MSTICLFCLKGATPSTSLSGDNKAYPIQELVELMMTTTPLSEFDGPDFLPLCSACHSIILEITQIQTQISQLQTAIGRRVLLLRNKIGDSDSSLANCADNKVLVEEEAKLRQIRKILLDLQDNSDDDAHIDFEVKSESVDKEFEDVKGESDPISLSEPDLRGYSPPSRKRCGSPPATSSTKRTKITPAISPSTSNNNSNSDPDSDSVDNHPNLDPLSGLDEEEQEIHHSSHLPTKNWIIQSQNGKNSQFLEERDPLILDPTDESPPEVSVHICKLCSKLFNKKTGLEIHMMVDHEDPSSTAHKPFPCPISGCRRRFAHKTNLARHVRLHKQDAERPYACRGCDSRFPDRASLSRHEKDGSAIHAKWQRSFCCYPCVKGFKSVRALKLHNLQVHKGGGRSTKMSLNSNKIQDHTHTTRNEKVAASTTSSTLVDSKNQSNSSSFPCQICGRYFETQMALRFHNGNPPLTCDICNTKCCGFRGLRIHKAEKHSTCDECGKMMANPRDLARHKKTHSLVFQKQDEDRDARDCTLCGKVFPSHTGLKVHLGKVRAECEFCGEKFCVAKGLKDHIDEKHTTCDECGYKVRDVKYLALHKAAHSVLDDHPVNKFNVSTDAPTTTSTNTTTTRAPIVKKKISCDFCFATFVSGGGKELHMAAKHPWNGVKTAAVVPNSCRVCGQDFQSQLSLRIHQGTRPLMCEICGKSCCGTLALQGHQREKHFTSGESGTRMKNEKEFAPHKVITEHPDLTRDQLLGNPSTRNQPVISTDQASDAVVGLLPSFTIPILDI